MVPTVTASPDYAALLRGVLADPASDFLRLVLADWIEEHGDGDRAEYIRDAVAFDALGYPEGPCPPGCQCGGAGTALKRTIAERGDEWAGAAFGPAVISELVWRRGFVSGVTLTLAAFVGGPCGECDGGYVRAGPDSHWCRACQGIGRTPGIAAALFAAHPIEEVTLPDVGTVQSFGGWHFARWPDGFVVDLQLYETTYLIREPLWSRELVGPFRSAADAYAALNRRCVAWGRESAGRPPIGGRP